MKDRNSKFTISQVYNMSPDQNNAIYSNVSVAVIAFSILVITTFVFLPLI